MPQNAGGGSSWSAYVIIGGMCCCLLLISSILFASTRGSSEPSVPIFAPPRGGSAPSGPAASPLPPAPTREEPIPTEEPDAKLAAFAFEPLTRPDAVPGKDGTIVRKPAGNPPYKLVQCGKGYAIRWMGKYFTVDSPNKLVWSESKQDPHSCFQIVPGYCNDQKYVMLRSLANKLFVRPDDSGLIVCKDTPTARNAKLYCWKLQPEDASVKPCGCNYSADLQRVVCTPCGPIKTTPAPGESCSTATPGYRASCCLQTRGNNGDRYCPTVAWPEVVGRGVQEAMLYLRTRRPDLTLRPCPMPCDASAYPTPQPNVVVIPYDPRTSFVVAPARVLV